MKTTKNLNLKVSEPGDRARIRDVSENFETLDQKSEVWSGLSNYGTASVFESAITIVPELPISRNQFVLIFKAPKGYQRGTVLVVEEIQYTLMRNGKAAPDGVFQAGELVAVYFDNATRLCWVGGGGNGARPNLLFAYTLTADGWTKNGDTYTKPMNHGAIGVGMKLNLAPGDGAAIAQLTQDGVLSMLVKNSGGSAEVQLTGGKPSMGVVLQVESIPTEGIANTPIYGDRLTLGNGSGYIASSAAPSNTRLLWIDTNTNLVKRYNGSSWVASCAVYA